MAKLTSRAKGKYYKNFIADITSLNGASVPEKAEAFAIEPAYADIEGIVHRNVIGVSSSSFCWSLFCMDTKPLRDVTKL
jgi:hypothetical protein